MRSFAVFHETDDGLRTGLMSRICKKKIQLISGLMGARINRRRRFVAVGAFFCIVVWNIQALTSGWRAHRCGILLNDRASSSWVDVGSLVIFLLKIHMRTSVFILHDRKDNTYRYLCCCFFFCFFLVFFFFFCNHINLHFNRSRQC